MNLEELKNKTILLFGKSRAFSEDEFEAQMRYHNITLTNHYNDDVVMIIDGKMMTPYEQNTSDALYEEKRLISVSIDVLEKALAASMDADTLLMSLKLSHDTKRLKSFLQNSMIEDALFLKLLKIYSWGGEDFFENDDNRDVSAALIARFYENIERNHNVQYATTGLYHLILQTDDAALLEAIALLEPIRKHNKMIQALLTHERVSKKVLKRFLKEDNFAFCEMMAYNPFLDKAIAKELLKDERLAQIIARNINLESTLFENLLRYSDLLAANESINAQMQKRLLDLQDQEVYEALAANEAISTESVRALLALKDTKIDLKLYANSGCDSELLSQAYKDEKNHTALASNKNTPQHILEVLYESGGEEILRALAKNENTPVDILYQLQLDSRFERAVKTNAAFGKHIQSQNIGWLV